MITSQRQLKVTLEKIESFKSSLRSKIKIKNSILAKAARVETQTIIEDLEALVEEYQDLVQNGLDAIKISTPEDLMLLPIRYRIAKK